MKCYIKGYDKVKYDSDATKTFQYDLDGVIDFKVVQGEENTGMQFDDWMPRDEFHEYLIVYFEDGSFTVYYNSHVGLFRY